MSDYGDKYCPICTTSELTAATKVYPLCECKLSICFDCLRRWAETKYCCPFCNISFTQNALNQTKEELRIRLRHKVAPAMLEGVIEDWNDLLEQLRSHMEIGLTVLNMDSPSDDDDEFYDLLNQPLQRSRTPFLPSSWGQRSSTASSYSNRHLGPPSVSNVPAFSIVQPSFSMSLTPCSHNEQANLRADHSCTLTITDDIQLPAPTQSAPNSPPTEFYQNIQRNVTRNKSANDHPCCTSLTLGITSSTDDWSFQNQVPMPIRLENYHERTLWLSSPTSIEDQQKWHNQHVDNFSISTVRSSKVDEFVRRHHDHLKSLLSNGLNVRDLVRIRPGTVLAKKFGPNSLGVIMKHSRELQYGASLEAKQPVSLILRLLDGSWLNPVRLEDVEPEGKKATLRQWLRIGDLLWTRFGIATAEELHPDSGQIAIQFLRHFAISEGTSCRSRGEIHQELRSVLFDSRAPSRWSHSGDVRETDEEPIFWEKKKDNKNEYHGSRTFSGTSQKDVGSPISEICIKWPECDGEDIVPELTCGNVKLDALTERPSILLQPAPSNDTKNLSQKLRICEPADFSKHLSNISLGSISLSSSTKDYNRARASYNVLPATEQGDVTPTLCRDTEKLKKIWYTDIKTVFSPQELLSRIERKLKRA